ncbi:tyrosine-type recombinase/integrase [Acidisoma silvae]|uniref:Site-specific integrase n=1 Tax=Acidisoma silvae TaxID=2802396 RepID=A0A963YUH4_9PROT|nr:site-specific integrase [Acidisoma silvae]MCB8877234.1 site-specific integrase [Acidisoma silvae]
MDELNGFTRNDFFEPPHRPHRAEGAPAIGAATEQAYQHDWMRFSQWCAEHDVSELPAHPQAVASFLESEKGTGAGIATLNRRIAAISYMHRSNQLPSPMTHEEASVIRAMIARPKVPTVRRTVQRPSIQIWQEIVEAIGEDTPLELRDRALISLHVSGAFRLIELARLSYAQVRFDRSSAQIHLGRFRSHTARGSSAITIMDDQLLNPVSHLRRWMDACPTPNGSLFRQADGGRISDQPLAESEIALIIAGRAGFCGYDAKAPDGGGLFQIRARPV